MQAKANGIHHHCTGPTRHVNGTSLNWKKVALIENIKVNILVENSKSK